MKAHTTLVVVVLALLFSAAAGCDRTAPQAGRQHGPASPRVVIVDDANFDAAVRDGVALIDFWAVWCGQCAVQAPIVDELADQFQGRARIVSLDVDAAPQTARKLGITAIPTLILFRDGKELGRFVGVNQAPTLAAAITAALPPVGHD